MLWQRGHLHVLLQHAVDAQDAGALAGARRPGQGVPERARAGWRCGRASMAPEPFGLMAGIAGIAYGGLRLVGLVARSSVLDLCAGPSSG